MTKTPGHGPSHSAAVKVLAHRGFAPDGAENTMPAFRAARDLGCRWIETDVNTTRDGVVLAFHDASLDRVTEGAGQINDVTYDDLTHLVVAGSSPVPTLREVLTELPELYVNIDVKDEASVAALPRVLAETGAADRVRIASFSDSRRARTLTAMTDLGLKPYSTSAGSTGFVTAMICLSVLPALWPVVRRIMVHRFPEFDALQMPLYLSWMAPRAARLPLLGWALRRVALPTRRLVRAAHAHGIAVHVWTVNNPTEMQMLLDRGVDALITDRADVALAVVTGTWPERLARR